MSQFLCGQMFVYVGLQFKEKKRARKSECLASEILVRQYIEKKDYGVVYAINVGKVSPVHI